MDINLEMPSSADLRKMKLAAFAATILLLSACGKQEISLKGREDSLAKRSVTAGQNVVVYPDDSPSVPDGRVVWEKMNCAVCHSDSGHGVPGKSKIDLASKEYERKQKPVDQFEFLSYGRSGIDHPKLTDKLSPRQVWDLVFYVRSLAQAPLTDAQVLEMLAVFGANCAVCHGVNGVGDGPDGRNLEPQPANFRNFVRFYDRTDDILWDHIANGIKWEGMPNFLGKQDKPHNVKFDNDYVWKLVQYIRHFHETTMPTLATNPEKPVAKPGSK